MSKIDFKTVVNVVGGIVLASALLPAACVTVARPSCWECSKRKSRNGYSNAVKAILDSDMFTSSKKEAIAVLATDRGEEYYQAIIHIVNSEIFDSQKLAMVKELSK